MVFICDDTGTELTPECLYISEASLMCTPCMITLEELSFTKLSKVAEQPLVAMACVAQTAIISTSGYSAAQELAT